MLEKFERRQRNLLHHAANLILDFCVEREAGTLVAGDIANIAKNKRKTKKAHAEAIRKTATARLASSTNTSATKANFVVWN